MKIKISRDVYNISNRIKNIDRNYFIMFNTSNEKFEVHSSIQQGNTYCLTVPYDFLDERTLQYVRKTQIANLFEILDQIENDNQRKESTEKSRAFSVVEQAVEEYQK